jgi:capsid assembly protease
MDEDEETRVVEAADAGRLAMAMPTGRFWAVHPDWAHSAMALLEGVSVVQLEEMRQAAQARSVGERQAEGYSVADGTATVEIVGAMTKRPHCLGELFGGVASTLLTERAISRALADDGVRDIVLHVETPGGEVAGAFDLAQAVRRADRKKPVYAYISDQGTSAGYLVASQARRVFANENALVGSIGVYTVLADTSMAYAQRGVKMYLVKAGKQKGVGAPGVPVTEEALASLQGRIDAFHALFLRSVARGRGMDERELARISDAGVYVGRQAIGYGLVDEVASVGAAVEMARTSKGRARTRKAEKMDDNVMDQEEAADVAAIVNGDIGDPAAAAEAPPAPAPGPGGPAGISMYFAVASALGVAGVTEASAEGLLRERLELGAEYDRTVRAAAVRFGQVAMGVDVSAFVATLPFEQAKAALGSYREMARAKGLLTDGRRQTAPAPDPAAPPTAARPERADGRNGSADPVATAREELRAAGVFNF